MNRLRSALALAATAALVAVGLPVTVAQASDLPTITRAHSDTLGDLGTLLVTVNAPHGVASLHAELTSVATGEQVATTDAFVLRSGTPQAGVWATAQPFLLESLGSYRVHVEVTDHAGNEVRRDNAGFLTYSVRTSIDDVTLDRTTVTYEEREVTISGKLTGLWPGTGEVRALSGFRIFVDSFLDFDQAITDEDGAFSGTVTIHFDFDFVTAAYLHDNSNPFFLQSHTDFFDIAIAPRQTQLTLKTKPHQVDRHETTTISGQLRWKTPQGWRPIPEALVGILFCSNEFFCSTLVGRPITDANGRFEVVHEPRQTGHYQVTYLAQDPVFGQPDPFVARADATAGIVVRQPATFSDFHAARDESGRVRVEGHLQFGNFSPGVVPVEIQFSTSGIAGWRTVATARAEWDGTGEGFELEIDWAQSGHWRAYYPGDPDWFQSAVSPVVFVD